MGGFHTEHRIGRAKSAPGETQARFAGNVLILLSLEAVDHFSSVICEVKGLPTLFFEIAHQLDESYIFCMRGWVHRRVIWAAILQSTLR